MTGITCWDITEHSSIHSMHLYIFFLNPLHTFNLYLLLSHCFSHSHFQSLPLTSIFYYLSCFFLPLFIYFLFSHFFFYPFLSPPFLSLSLPLYYPSSLSISSHSFTTFLFLSFLPSSCLSSSFPTPIELFLVPASAPRLV